MRTTTGYLVSGDLSIVLLTKESMVAWLNEHGVGRQAIQDIGMLGADDDREYKLRFDSKLFRERVSVVITRVPCR